MALAELLGAITGRLGFVVQLLTKLPQVKKIAVGLVVLITLLNFKNWPLVWHGRFYYSLYEQLFRRRKELPLPSHIFAPISWISRSSFYECDLNLHKSNSTYFSDLDIARTYLMTALIKKSLKIRQRKGQALYVALAGTQCLFRKEIKPFDKYEVVSRLLTWDDKWVWVVSHFVKLGGGKKGSDGHKERKIYATALSKYVFKNGRITVTPEEVLRESGLLPERPEGAVSSGVSMASKGSIDDEGADLVKLTTAERVLHGVAGTRTSLADLMQPTLKADGFEGEWTWERIEQERARALEVTRHMLAMDTLDEEYVGTGREKGAFGVFNSLA